MATGKRFYWMKLKESFMTSDTIDFFMSQPNGAQYVVLYQMLCLKTINTDGKLERQIGEVLIPYDIGKIKRDMKWFSEDTIRVALQMYKSFGLIYEDQNGTLVMADHENLVGSETDYAEKNRRIRNKRSPGRLTEGHNVSSNVSENVTTENRDRDIEKEIEIEKDLTDSKESVCRTGDVRRVKEAWNALGLSQISSITSDSKRGKMLKARIMQNGLEKVLEAVERIQKSSFLCGQNRRGWTITFDWFVRPNNFPKVLEGQYDDHEGTATGYGKREPVDFVKILGGDDE